MQKKIAKHFSLIMFAFFLLLLSACGSIQIDLKQDGSGKAKIELPNNHIISKEEIEHELKSETNDEEGISRIKVKEKKDIIEASFKFDNLYHLDNDAYQIPVADYAVLEDDRLKSLKFADEEIEFTKKSEEVFLKVPKDLNDFDQAQITVDGHIIAYSDGLELIDKSTAEIQSSGSLYLVYEPKSSIGKIILNGLILLIIAGGLYYFLRKRTQNKNIDKTPGDEHA